MCLKGGIECIHVVHRAVGVRHSRRVNLTAEIAFRWCNFDVFIVGVDAMGHTDYHFSPIANDGGYRELWEVRSTGFKHRGHLWDGDDLLDAVRGTHSCQVETIEREVNDDLLFAARNQLDLGSDRRIAADTGPLLGHCHE